MDRGHKSLFDAPVIFDYFADRCQTVCSTRRIGYDRHILRVFVVVYTHNECRRRLVLGRCCDDNLLRTLIDMYHSFLGRVVRTGTFYDIFGTTFRPRDIGCIAFTVHWNPLSIDDDPIFINIKFFWKATEYRIVFQHVNHVFLVSITHIDPGDLDLRHIHRCTNHYT